MPSDAAQSFRPFCCQAARVTSPQRFRAGTAFPATWLVLGAFIAIATLFMGVGAITTWLATPGEIFYLVLLLFPLLISLGCLSRGINALRPVLLDETSLKLPTLSLRHGFSHLAIPLDDVAGVEMVYSRGFRDQHWQLSVIRLQHANVRSDCLTSFRGEKRGVSGTAVGRAVDSLRGALPADRLARWNLP